MAKSKPLVKPKESTYTKTQAENDNVELAKIKEQMKTLKKREEELINRLTNFMLNSVKEDAKGHRLFTVLGEDGKPRHLQRQRRRKVVLNQERAIPWLFDNDFDQAVKRIQKVAPEVTQDQIVDVLLSSGYDSYIEEKLQVDEITLAQLVTNGAIDMEDMEALCDFEDTYAMTYIKDEDVKKAQAEAEEESATKEEEHHATAPTRKAVHPTQRQANRPVPHIKARS